MISPQYASHSSHTHITRYQSDVPAVRLDVLVPDPVLVGRVGGLQLSLHHLLPYLPLSMLPLLSQFVLELRLFLPLTCGVLLGKSDVALDCLLVLEGAGEVELDGAVGEGRVSMFPAAVGVLLVLADGLS